MNTANLFAPAFDLGQVVATPEVMGLVELGLTSGPKR
jgi:hypothetical protein